MIPIALCRSQTGPSGPKWEKKMAEEWIFRPHLEKGQKNGRKIGKLAQKSIFYPVLGQIHFSAIFCPFSRWGQNPFFGHFLPFRAGGPIWGLYRAIGIATSCVILLNFQFPVRFSEALVRRIPTEKIQYTYTYVTMSRAPSILN